LEEQADGQSCDTQVSVLSQSPGGWLAYAGKVPQF